MKIASIIAIGAVVLSASTVSASTRTVISRANVQGSHFIVRIHLDDRLVSVTLKKSAETISESELERRLQLAVWGTVGGDCQMVTKNRRKVGNETVGKFVCPFD